MIVLRHDGIVVEVLVEVRLAVMVQVVQARDLITACHVHFPVDHLEAQRLEQARRIPAPRQLVEFIVEA